MSIDGHIRRLGTDIVDDNEDAQWAEVLDMAIDYPQQAIACALVLLTLEVRETNRCLNELAFPFPRQDERRST